MTKKEFSVFIFWGSIWGIFEATVGYVLHSLDFSFGFLLWFPAAYYFLNKVFQQTGKAQIILFTSFVAAAIKLIDFLLPVRIDKVLNPSVSILLEGLAVYAVVRFRESRKHGLFRSDLMTILIASIGWRALYILYLLPLPDFIVAVSPLRGTEPLMTFLLIHGILGWMVISAFLIAGKLYQSRRSKDIKERLPGHRNLFGEIGNYIYIHPAISVSLLFFALFIQWII